jgi:NADPH-dependent 7-cyano-7-deazaguanine reductase QueF-like protein
MFKKLIESLDIDLLVKEMNDTNMNPLEKLHKFISTDLSNETSYKLKQNQAVIKLKELSRKEGNYSYGLYAQIFLF